MRLTTSDLVKKVQELRDVAEQRLEAYRRDGGQANSYLEGRFLALEDAATKLDELVKKEESDIKQRLEYLRGELRAEQISYGELHELQCLADYIEDGDVELQEAAGIPEDEARK